MVKHTLIKQYIARFLYFTYFSSHSTKSYFRNVDNQICLTLGNSKSMSVSYLILQLPIDEIYDFIIFYLAHHFS